jgi:hypothetical protein
VTESRGANAGEADHMLPVNLDTRFSTISRRSFLVKRTSTRSAYRPNHSYRQPQYRSSSIEYSSTSSV